MEGSLSIQNISKFFPEITSACKEQLTFASHTNQTHPCLVEVNIRLITSKCLFKIGIKNHTSEWSELWCKARAIIKQMFIEPLIPYLPTKNYPTASGSICDSFFVSGNDVMSMTYFAFFVNISLMIPLLQSYICLKTMLPTLWKDGQQDMEFTVNREPSLFIKFSIY